MATYATGTATDPNDLLDQFATFIEANGWTRDALSSVGSGKRYHAHNGTDYVNIRSAVAETIYAQQAATGTGWGLYMGSGYDGGANWNAQAGGPIGTGQTYTVGCGMILGAGAVTGYHFFADSASGNNIVVVVEKSTGIFTHCGFGTSLTKTGMATYGQYFFSIGGNYYFGTGATSNYPGRAYTADCPCTSKTAYNDEGCYFVKADVDTFTGKWLYGGMTGSTAGIGYTGKRAVGSPVSYAASSYGVFAPTGLAHYYYYQGRQLGTYNSQAILLPVRIWAYRDDAGYSVIGSLPTVWYFHGCVAGYFANKDVFAIGGDNYMGFPYFAVKKV